MNNVDFSGVLPIVKPPGPTSQDIVSDVKRLLKVKKVGHAGTLDPYAAGIIPICIGKATRLFDYLIERNKSYRCEIQLGITTDTLDSAGKITARADTKTTESEFVEVLRKFVGVNVQKPPTYSALKIGGKKLYQLEREGIDEKTRNELREKKSREIEVFSLDFVRTSGENRFVFDVACSKGTYIRVLCEDIAYELGTVGYMSFLLRTTSGGIDVSLGITIDELSEAVDDQTALEYVLNTQFVLADLDEVRLGEAEYKAVTNGVPVKVGMQDIDKLRVYCTDEFLGIGAVRNKMLKITTTLR